MSKILYFDTFNGVAGDMILGALLDLGVPFEYLKTELGKLQLEGYELCAEPIDRRGLRGVNFRVLIEESREDHRHAPDPKIPGTSGHNHPAKGHGLRRNRGLQEIEKLITTSPLPPAVRDRACRIFRRLGEAEAKVHNSSLEDVHFHEVGAIDAIVDVVGACICFDYLKIDEFYCGAINLGGGTVTFSHGTWPVPAPATAELVKDFPTRLGTVPVELTTPTGAAIVTTLAKPAAVPPVARYSLFGWGAGDRELSEIPNMLRVIVGESSEPDETPVLPPEGVQEELITVLEATIDDMDAQGFGYFMDLALRRGALDCYYTPVQMKKNRPAVLLTLLCTPGDQLRMVELLFAETTTLGVRTATCRRWALPREIVEIATRYGPVRVKIGRRGGRAVNVSPEYEDLKLIAERTGEPLKSIKRQVLEQLGKSEDYE